MDGVVTWTEIQGQGQGPAIGLPWNSPDWTFYSGRWSSQGLQAVSSPGRIRRDVTATTKLIPPRPEEQAASGRLCHPESGPRSLGVCGSAHPTSQGPRLVVCGDLGLPTPPLQGRGGAGTLLESGTLEERRWALAGGLGVRPAVLEVGAVS